MSTKVPSNTTCLWVEKLPELRGNVNSHHRRVFISAENALTHRWVAKIQILRTPKSAILPLGEEVAYKICKLFCWNTIPKTKVMHEYSIKPKYSQLATDFTSAIRCSAVPFTITFQLYVEGETLPGCGQKKTQTPNVSSYHRGYLLDILLGRYDARGDNTIYNSKTNELFEIDNEFLGFMSYDPWGILRDFADLKQKEIATDLLDKVLQVKADQIVAIRNKYKEREKILLKFWSEELLNVPQYGREEKIEQCWSVMINNFKFMQEGILSFKSKDEPITLQKIENFIKEAHRSSLASKNQPPGYPWRV